MPTFAAAAAILPSGCLSTRSLPHLPAAQSLSSAIFLPPQLRLLSSSSSSTKPCPTIRMGGGPRTYPGGVSKWQWKRMQASKAKQLLKARLLREKQIYEMRKRAELKAAISELERPWEAAPEVRAPTLFAMGADEHLKVLADRFQRPGGFDMWSPRDGPQVFRPFDGLPSARFFPKGSVHSVLPYGRSNDDDDDDDDGGVDDEYIVVDDDDDEDDDNWVARGEGGAAGRIESGGRGSRSSVMIGGAAAGRTGNGHREMRRSGMIKGGTAGRTVNGHRETRSSGMIGGGAAERMGNGYRETRSSGMIGGRAARRTGNGRVGTRSSEMIRRGDAGEEIGEQENGYGRKSDFQASNGGSRRRFLKLGEKVANYGRKNLPGSGGAASGREIGEKRNGYEPKTGYHRRAGKVEAFNGGSRSGFSKSDDEVANVRNGGTAAPWRRSLGSNHGGSASPKHGRTSNWDKEDGSSDVDLSWVV